MLLGSRIRSAYRRMFGHVAYDERGGFAASHGFHDQRTSVHGPDGTGT